MFEQKRGTGPFLPTFSDKKRTRPLSSKAFDRNRIVFYIHKVRRLFAGPRN
jgi:hypothetical protein